PPAAGGVRWPPAARRPGLSPGRPRAGCAADRQRPLARRQDHRRGPGGQPAPGAEAAARLQPAAQRHRAVLEAATAAGGRTTGLRHEGRPEAVAACEPVLLPDRAAPHPEPRRRVLHPARQTDSVSRTVNQKASLLTDSPEFGVAMEYHV